MNWAWVPQVPQRISSAVVSDPQKKIFVPMINIAAPVYYHRRGNAPVTLVEAMMEMMRHANARITLELWHIRAALDVGFCPEPLVS